MIAVCSIGGLGKAILVTTVERGTLIGVGVANALSIGIGVSRTRVAALDEERGKGVVAL